MTRSCIGRRRIISTMSIVWLSPFHVPNPEAWQIPSCLRMTIYASNLMTSVGYVMSAGMPIPGISMPNMAGKAVSVRKIILSARSMASGILRLPSAMSIAILSIMGSARLLSDTSFAQPTLFFRRPWGKNVPLPFCPHAADTERCQATSSLRRHIGWTEVGWSFTKISWISDMWRKYMFLPGPFCI